MGVDEVEEVEGEEISTDGSQIRDILSRRDTSEKKRRKMTEMMDEDHGETTP